MGHAPRCHPRVTCCGVSCSCDHYHFPSGLLRLDVKPSITKSPPTVGIHPSLSLSRSHNATVISIVTQQCPPSTIGLPPFENIGMSVVLPFHNHGSGASLHVGTLQIPILDTVWSRLNRFVVKYHAGNAVHRGVPSLFVSMQIEPHARHWATCLAPVIPFWGGCFAVF